MIVCLFDFQGGLLHGFCGVVLLYLSGFVAGVFASCVYCLGYIVSWWLGGMSG